MAHDFNNILAVLMIQLSLLAHESTLPEPVVTKLKGLEELTQRAARLTRQLLMFSRREATSMQVMDLNQALVDEFKMLSRILGEHIEISFRNRGLPVWIHADAGMMDQVVMNLCVNARDAMPNGGQLVVETELVTIPSGAATETLARPDAAVAAVFGAGVQARAQLEAVCCARHIGRARVYDVNAAGADQFAEEMSRKLNLPVERAVNSAQALEGASVVCTATTSATPVFQDHELAPGAHVNAVGAYKPNVTEIPSATVCRAHVVVDHRPSALEEAGDLLVPLKQGLIQERHFSTELGEVLAGRSPGRRNATEITLFKSVGVAIQDLCAAARAFENARRFNLGIELPR